jgi:hypothetical protein
MPDPTPVADQSIWPLLVGKLLDWPFLLFLLIIFFMARSGQSLAELLKSRKFDVELGGNKLSIGDAVQALDDETKQAVDDFRKHQEEINAIKARVDSLEANKLAPVHEGEAIGNQSKAVPSPPDEIVQRDDHGRISEEEREAAFRRMVAAMSNSKFRWRTIERLAIEAGVSESEAHKRLAAHHPREVVLSKSKSGKTICRLPDR